MLWLKIIDTKVWVYAGLGKEIAEFCIYPYSVVGNMYLLALLFASGFSCCLNCGLVVVLGFV